MRRACRLRLRSVALLLASFGVACAVSGASHAAGKLDWSHAVRVSVDLADYQFVPAHLTLQRGTVYRLHLRNVGKEMHEFTAPGFLAASLVQDSSKLANGGREVVLQPGASADIEVVPQRAGHFEIACADHDWEGMVGEIEVK